MLLDVDFVVTIHDQIILEFEGVAGFASGGRGGVESALHRVSNHIEYTGLGDVFGIAALYAVAIARGHVFNDGNKRTGLACALTFLLDQGIEVKENPAFEQIMVDVAEGKIDHAQFADILGSIWEQQELSGH